MPQAFAFGNGANLGVSAGICTSAVTSMQRCSSEQCLVLVDLLYRQRLYVLLLSRTGLQSWQNGDDLVLASPWLSHLLQKHSHRSGALSLFVNGRRAKFDVIF